MAEWEEGERSELGSATGEIYSVLNTLLYETLSWNILY